MITLFLILLIVATLFRIFPPQNINSIYGYRTSKSKKNLVNWKIANRHAFILFCNYNSSNRKKNIQFIKNEKNIYYCNINY
jgi:hypothetical protein